MKFRHASPGLQSSGRKETRRADAMRLDDMFIAGTGVCLAGLVSAEEGVRRGWYGAAEATESGWTSAAVAGDLPAPDMAVRAARTALARSAHDPDDIAVLMHASSLHQG